MLKSHPLIPMVQWPGSLAPTTSRYSLEPSVISLLLSPFILDDKKNKLNSITYQEQVIRLGNCYSTWKIPTREKHIHGPLSRPGFLLNFPEAY